MTKEITILLKASKSDMGWKATEKLNNPIN